MAISRVPADDPKLLDILKQLADPVVGADHINSEKELFDWMNNYDPDLNILRIVDSHPDHNSFWGLSYDSNNQILILPLRRSTGNTHTVNHEMEYRHCTHDVAAIRIDDNMLKLAGDGASPEEQKDIWKLAIEYLSDKICEYLDLIYTNRNLNNRCKFKLIIFDDSDDLESKLIELSKSELIFPETDRDEDEQILFPEEFPPTTKRSLSLRSLHLLLPDKTNTSDAVDFSAFFLNVLSGDSEVLDLCDYSSRIDCAINSTPDTSVMVGNFVSFVIGFLISINLRDPDRFDDDFGDMTRCRTIERNLQAKTEGLLSSAFFCEKKQDSDVNEVTTPLSNLDSFDRLYEHHGLPHSSLYTWLNECNLRVFRQPMKGGDKIPFLQWQTRDHFHPQYDKIISFLSDLESCSDKWQRAVDALPPSKLRKNLKKSVKLRSLESYRDFITILKEDSTFDEIRSELISSQNHLESIQLEFYSEILRFFPSIHERCSSPSGHELQKGPYGFIKAQCKVTIQNLMLLSIHEDLCDLCNYIIRFEKETKNDGIDPAIWNGYYSDWALKKRGD